MSVNLVVMLKPSGVQFRRKKGEKKRRNRQIIRLSSDVITRHMTL